MKLNSTVHKTPTRTQHQLASSSGLHAPSLRSVVGLVLRCLCLFYLMFSRGSTWTLASFQRLRRSAVVPFTCGLSTVAQTSIEVISRSPYTTLA